MPISFPRTLPSWLSGRAIDSDLSVITTDVTPRIRSGAMLAVEIADPYWTYQAEFVVRTRTEELELKAWRNSLGGRLRSFLAGDPRRCYPASYTASQFAALSPFDGTCTVSALSANSISLAGLPAGFVLKAGDYVGLSESGSRDIYSVAENATADGSGDADVTVYPAVRTTLFSTSAAANVKQPVAEWVLEAMEFSGIERAKTVSIRATQKP